MSEKSKKRLRLEASLAEDPTDTFLRYALALQCMSEGEHAEGRERLLGLIADHPNDQVPAYQQLGQSFMATGENDEARKWFQAGIVKAKAVGDWHAAGEMDGFLAQMD
jgi:thioredoxin-like negative regulator of GroEL